LVTDAVDIDRNGQLLEAIIQRLTEEKAKSMILTCNDLNRGLVFLRNFVNEDQGDVSETNGTNQRKNLRKRDRQKVSQASQTHRLFVQLLDLSDPDRTQVFVENLSQNENLRIHYVLSSQSVDLDSLKAFLEQEMQPKRLIDSSLEWVHLVTDYSHIFLSGLAKDMKTMTSWKPHLSPGVLFLGNSFKVTLESIPRLITKESQRRSGIGFALDWIIFTFKTVFYLHPLTSAKLITDRIQSRRLITDQIESRKKRV